MRHPIAPRSAAGGDAAADAGATAVRWDLRPLYESATDPRVGADIAEAARQAAAFAARYRGRIASADLTADALRDLLAEHEAIHLLGARPAYYASLLTAADTQDPVALDLE